MKPKSNTIGQSIATALRNPSFMIGSVIILIILALALFPGMIATHDPDAISPTEALQAPSAEHWFGTDNYGRDMFSRCIYAAQVDLKIGVFSALIPLLFGSLVGLVAGYYGKYVDMVLMRFLDVVAAFPFVVLVITIIAILGQGLQNLYIAMWMVYWVGFAKLVRAEVLRLKNSEFIMACKVSGFSDGRILFFHILPNAISPAIVYFASYIVVCMLTGASMSFLGLGVQPPTSEWGSLLNMGRGYISNAPWMTVFPGVFLAVTGVGFSLMGDGLNDFLRAKGR